MKLIAVAAALLSFAAMVAAARKKYIIYPTGTHSSTVDLALVELEAGGAKLLHRYS